MLRDGRYAFIEGRPSSYEVIPAGPKRLVSRHIKDKPQPKLGSKEMSQVTRRWLLSHKAKEKVASSNLVFRSRRRPKLIGPINSC